MATTIDRPEGAPEPPLEPVVSEETPKAPEVGAKVSEMEEEQVQIGPVLRPLAAAALTSGAAGLMTGGIFGVWNARVMGMTAAFAGVVWAWLTLRQKRPTLLQGLALPVAGGLGLLTLIPDSNPGDLPELIREAVSSGRLLRPPVPFDPGWRPVLVVIMFMLGFAAAWVAAALQRPQLALMLPLLVLGFTAISQPAESEVIAGLFAFVPTLGALAVLYGGDLSSASQLTSQFELRRAIRGGAYGVIAIIVLIGLARANFLFPKPAYNPDKPQKPKSIPLSKVEDRVLFEIEAQDFTGPWRTGVLDVYDGISWRLPPFDDARYVPVPDDGVVDNTKVADVTVKFTVRDIGASPTFPGTATPVKITFPAQKPSQPVVFDPRSDTFRVKQGRVDKNTVYEISLPKYPTADQLKNAQPASRTDPERLEIRKAPPAVQDLLNQAPKNPWERLDFLRGKLLAVAVAAGAGQPKDVKPAKVQDILAGSHEASPFEIVAAEAMLARWAGVQSRIGFGFDGFNDESGVKTIRPKNGSSWLEVYFEGYGWTPLIATPQQAKSSLDTDPNSRFDVNIQPSEDVAVEVYIPIELENVLLLYQRIRRILLQILPYAVALLALYLAYPSAMRALRRSRRRRWAQQIGPRARVGVEYAEFRDWATDLNVGDPFATPLEYLSRLQDDDEHAEFAWLVTRTMYGDLAQQVTDDDAMAAEEMSTSLQRRMFRAQPMQSRLLAVVSRASLRLPFSTEVPTIRQVRLPRLRAKPTLPSGPPRPGRPGTRVTTTRRRRRLGLPLRRAKASSTRGRP